MTNDREPKFVSSIDFKSNWGGSSLIITLLTNNKVYTFDMDTNDKRHISMSDAAIGLLLDMCEDLRKHSDSVYELGYRHGKEGLASAAEARSTQEKLEKQRQYQERRERDRQKLSLRMKSGWARKKESDARKEPWEKLAKQLGYKDMRVMLGADTSEVKIRLEEFEERLKSEPFEQQQFWENFLNGGSLPNSGAKKKLLKTLAR